ncbi:cytochrome C oxidase subunit IV family protein [Aldersonia kunmingensis]|uniref:cytochrome C oxidase subunit IV family protein n=1 Tax=Aldersonia kunmingensis TaxID=408066 RepID=UPI000833BBBF|nr:cytochrome C oxidase subunit IV family protein [Aldersonia kunmingensis]
MTNQANASPRPISQRSITWAWLALVAITIGSGWLAPAHVAGPVQPSTAITFVVVVLAAIKSRVIIQYFMEVRAAPRWLIRATDAWLTVLVVAILGIYLS